jgi:hypothetical protein
MAKHISKRLVGSALGAVGVGIAVGAVQAEAQSITLSGTVTQSCNLTVTPGGSYNTLNLTTTQTDVMVGTIAESCNDGKGYKVTIGTRYGTDSGMLKGSTYHQSMTYGVNYGSVNTLTFAGSTATATDSHAAGYTTVTLGVSYAAGTQLTADTYTDTLTFTMATN